MSKMHDVQVLQQSLQSMVDNKSIFSLAMKVESGDGNISWAGAAGTMEVESRYFIASVTKMYITVIVMKLMEEGKIDLQDPISKHLPHHYCDGLHVLKWGRLLRIQKL